DHIRVTRRVDCAPDQIVVTAGAQQALFICCQLFTDPGDQAWIENPGYRGARNAFQAAGVEIKPVPVDRDGLDVDYGLAHYPNAQIAYVTPSHQYPLGGILSLARRMALINWASTGNRVILEDDYDSEFRYSGHPLASLQGLDQASRVIYIGTFSKVLFPSLRLGYLVIPPGLAEYVAAARANVDRGSDLITQLTLNQFMRAGHYARHIRRMGKLYKERQATLVREIRSQLDDRLTISPAPAGLHLVGRLKSGIDDREVSNHLKHVGIDAPPLSNYSVTRLKRGGLVLGYASQGVDKIVEGVDKIAKTWRSAWD
ncbi:MAG: PLP-dependent aminotransferase family protein, partial [Chloroflexota bacterium]